jgi:hypothetical protein
VSVLHSRIVNEDYLDTPAHHPDPGGEIMTMPVQLVTYAGDRVLYGTVHPLVTADGATVPAYADVTYPSVIPAGRA